MNKLLTRGVLTLMLTCVVSIPALSQKNAVKENPATPSPAATIGRMTG